MSKTLFQVSLTWSPCVPTMLPQHPLHCPHPSVSFDFFFLLSCLCWLMFLRCNYIVPLCMSPPFIDTTPACLRLNFCKSFFFVVLPLLTCVVPLHHATSLPRTASPLPRATFLPHAASVPCATFLPRAVSVPCAAFLPCATSIPHAMSLSRVVHIVSLSCTISPLPHTTSLPSLCHVPPASPPPHAAPTPLPLAYLGCMTSWCLCTALDASPLVSVHVPAPACTCIRIIELD